MNRPLHRHDIELFYDGKCPLCSREIAWLRRLDGDQRVLFTDLAAPGFHLPDRSLGELMRRIHGRLPDGSFVEGVEAFRRVYGAIGFKRMVAMTRWPVIRSVLEILYRAFAANRLRWTGRCEQIASVS